MGAIHSSFLPRERQAFTDLQLGTQKAASLTEEEGSLKQSNYSFAQQMALPVHTKVLLGLVFDFLKNSKPFARSSIHTSPVLYSHLRASSDVLMPMCGLGVPHLEQFSRIGRPNMNGNHCARAEGDPILLVLILHSCFNPHFFTNSLFCSSIVLVSHLD